MGMAGNKGAVAIRMDYGDTSFCFVAAHFASGRINVEYPRMIIMSPFWIGQANVEDRNNDFYTINEGLRFLRGRTIDSHE